MAKTRNKYLDYLIYVAMRLSAMFVHILGLPTGYRAAGLLGSAVFALDRKHRRRALGHLQRSFPDWPEARCRRVARAAMRGLAYLGLEMIWMPRLITPTCWRQRLRLVNMAEPLRLLLERKTGLIFVTGHFGNWEVAGYAMAALGFENFAVARPLDNPYVNAYVLALREKAGLRILTKKGATENVDGLLASREAVDFIADQDAGRKGVFVDFFGRPASTFKSIGLMAMRHGAPILVAHGRRLDETFRFEVGVSRIIYPRDWADKADPLQWITQEYTAALEQVVRAEPEQYWWFHRRWKHRPKGQPPAPEGIA